jgi:hypothetical protein
LYESETWAWTLREEHRLELFENRVLRKIFGLKRDEVMGGWRKVHNYELHNLHSLPCIIRMIKPRNMKWEGHVAHRGEKKNEYWSLMGKPEGKRLLRRPRYRWEDNIVTCISDCRWGVDLVNGFIDHLYLTLRTTSSYNIIVDFDTTDHPTRSLISVLSLFIAW